MDFNKKLKTIEKLIKSDFNNDEKIKNMKIEDIWKIKGLTNEDISNIKLIRESIKNKNFMSYFITSNIKGGDI